MLICVLLLLSHVGNTSMTKGKVEVGKVTLKLVRLMCIKVWSGLIYVHRHQDGGYTHY